MTIVKRGTKPMGTVKNASMDMEMHKGTEKPLTDHAHFGMEPLLNHQ
jgi:hypothetical protein